MKDHPILFSGPMVRAIIEGRKTQTRRIIKLPHNNPLGVWEPSTVGGGSTFRIEKGQRIPVPEMNCIWHTRQGTTILCPHGQPGDRLWVREEFSGLFEFKKTPPRLWHPDTPIWYWADGNPPDGDWTKPKPSIHMPRWASRITLEITDVRVERLIDISKADAIAEGINTPTEQPDGAWDFDPRDEFCDLWQKINGEDSWDKNPWVWVVTFRRIECAAS